MRAYFGLKLGALVRVLTMYSGFEPGALVIILQTAATYAAIGSAYIVLRPILRGQRIQAHRDTLASVNEQGDAGALVAAASAALATEAQAKAPKAERDNSLGCGLLILSFILLSLALAIQIATDPAFHPINA